MLDVEVIDDPAAAVVAMDPTRARLLLAAHWLDGGQTWTDEGSRLLWRALMRPVQRLVPPPFLRNPPVRSEGRRPAGKAGRPAGWGPPTRPPGPRRSASPRC